MKLKLALGCGAGLFIGLFLLIFWYGSLSVLHRSDMLRMESKFQTADKALRSGQRVVADRFYRAATADYQRGLSKAVYYPRMGGEYLTAGNCYWQLRQLRAAIQCYELGLECDPFSITLLTSLGSCAFRLGERQIALAALEKSRQIYPLKKSARRILRQLKSGVKGER